MNKICCVFGPGWKGLEYVCTGIDGKVVDFYS